MRREWHVIGQPLQEAGAVPAAVARGGAEAERHVILRGGGLQSQPFSTLQQCASGRTGGLLVLARRLRV